MGEEAAALETLDFPRTEGPLVLESFSMRCPSSRARDAEGSELPSLTQCRRVPWTLALAGNLPLRQGDCILLKPQ